MPILELGSIFSLMVKMHLEVVFSPRNALLAVPFESLLSVMVIFPLISGSQEEALPF